MLPSMQLSPDRLDTVTGMQYSEEDRLVLRKLGDMNPLLPAVVKVKKIFSFIFEQLDESSFFALTSHDNILALLFIHRKAIEIQRCTPVFDVFYTFCNESLHKRLF